MGELAATKLVAKEVFAIWRLKPASDSCAAMRSQGVAKEVFAIWRLKLESPVVYLDLYWLLQKRFSRFGDWNSNDINPRCFRHVVLQKRFSRFGDWNREPYHEPCLAPCVAKEVFAIWRLKHQQSASNYTSASPLQKRFSRFGDWNLSMSRECVHVSICCKRGFRDLAIETIELPMRTDALQVKLQKRFSRFGDWNIVFYLR